MAYQIPVLRDYVVKYKMEVHVVYWNDAGNAPYIPDKIDGVVYYKRSEHNLESLKSITEIVKPNLIFISGWQDKDYMKVVLPYKRKGIPVVMGIDDIWYGSLRQIVGALVFPFLFKKFYSHAWVSGPRQFEFARKLGFSNKNIIYNLYSGNTNLFQENITSLTSKLEVYPRKFLFVGRYVEAKAIDVLIKAFQIYQTQYNGDWELICVGKGPLESLIKEKKGVKVYDYLSQSEILSLLNEVGVFVLPSRVDVSPLVVHEFASAGLPLILSDSIGNRLTFLIDNFNGFSFIKDSATDLADKMNKISNLSQQKLVEMSYNSARLSTIHDTKFVSASFMSLLLDKDS